MNHQMTSIISNISKLQNHRLVKHFRFRRKGTIMVEFLATLPLFFMLAWATWQILFFASSITTAQNAALDGAHFLSNELRGFNGNQLTELDPTAQERMQNGLMQRTSMMTSYNGVFLLFHDQTSAQTPTIIWGDEASCRAAFQNDSHKRVMCAYLTTSPTYSDVKQVKVSVKAEFWVLGNFIPGIEGNLFAKGYGFSILDNPDRYQYYTP